MTAIGLMVSERDSSGNPRAVFRTRSSGPVRPDGAGASQAFGAGFIGFSPVISLLHADCARISLAQAETLF
jgi:hypothetical protein